MEPFNHNYFLGYINEVTPQFVKIHFPSSNLLAKFYHKGVNFAGGNVGNFIVIEGEEFGFLARINEIALPDSEKREINEKLIENDESSFHPSGKAELLLSFSVFEPQKTQKTASKYPAIGSKVHSCSDEQISKYVEEFGKKEGDSIFTTIGKLTSNEADCNVSLNAIFGRHCAIIGTTGGGKSWTVSKLIESLIQKTNNKIILIDATGEYRSIKSSTFILGTNSYFPYQKLTIPDLFFLLRPTGQSQRPILLEAIRSLKMMRLIDKNGIYEKRNNQKIKFNKYYKDHIKEIEDNSCNFDITYLVPQIKEECIYPTGRNDITTWGDYDNKTYDYQTSLISRITDLINTDIFNKLMGFDNIHQSNISIIQAINEFIPSNMQQNVLRISFEDIPSSFYAKEIVSNALASYLLNKARSKEFRNSAVVLFVDEAHQFLNNRIEDENSGIQALESFDLIAKECRKYGLFLCLATQMPKDIPIGTLSQMGTFIVHRIINEQDKRAVESAVTSANRTALSFLPVLGEGEALLVGVDFPMPLLIKVGRPMCPPLSETPRLLGK
ncbi:MAG: ATP-binding protein [Bacteroidales bacterium]|jgi:energy-coupling factor transporter ATP-binding protein EcfA2|nr:ATP-binding protein [Bacteroidales bacterium]